MMRSSLLLAALLSSAPAFAAHPDITPSASSILDPEGEGRQLAVRLRGTRPSENAEFCGTLIVRQRGTLTNSVPVCSFLVATPTNWLVTYQTPGNATTSAERLTILHAPGQPNQYLLATGTNALSAAFLPPPLAPASIDSPFAGSHFQVSDLGLDFLHWPQQRLLKHQMTRGQSCRVLESINPSPRTNGYSRVISWIHVDTDGILRAEAYDTAGKLIKEFLVGPVRKINGQWQLQDMKMVSLKTRGETELRFDLDGK